jgi:ribosome silencing factor RsfS/YbeB/iojap
LGTSKTIEGQQGPEHLKTLIASVLDDNKAQDIEVIDLKGLTSIADYMIVATGQSNRQVIALADKVSEKLKEAGYLGPRVEGMPHGDWVIVDAYDIIVHLFRPEVREFYNIEKMWRPEPGFKAPAGATGSRPVARP